MAHRRTGLDLMEQVSAVVRTQDEVDRYVEGVCDAVLNHLPACEAVAMHLIVDGGLRTVCFTARSDAVEQPGQSPEGEPCLASMQTRTRLSTTERVRTDWPSFADYMERHGFGSILSVTLATEDKVLGSMGLYAVAPDAFDEDDVVVAAAAGQVCADTVAAAREIIDARELAEQLEQAMQSRAAIEQAKGILMAVRGVDQDQAFEIIRKSSQDQNIKVRDIAEQIVAGASRLSPGGARR